VVVDRCLKVEHARHMGRMHLGFSASHRRVGFQRQAVCNAVRIEVDAVNYRPPRITSEVTWSTAPKPTSATSPQHGHGD